MLSPPSPAPLLCVLDTNVVLDLFHFADPAALPLLKALEAGRLISLVDEATLAELARVLTYQELSLKEEQAYELLHRYRRYCQEAGADRSTAVSLPRCKDPDDQKFLELAARTGASLLISKYKALLTLSGKPGLRFRILTPKAAAEYMI